MRATFHVEPEAARRGEPSIIMHQDDGTVDRLRHVAFNGVVTLNQRDYADTNGIKVWLEADTTTIIAMER